MTPNHAPTPRLTPPLPGLVALAAYPLALLVLAGLALNARRLARAEEARVVTVAAGYRGEVRLRRGNRLAVLLGAPDASAWRLDPRDYWPLEYLSSGGKAPGTQEFVFAAKATGLVRLVFVRPPGNAGGSGATARRSSAGRTSPPTPRPGPSRPCSWTCGDGGGGGGEGSGNLA